MAERGEIIMQYEDRGCSLDLSSAGRGLHQTLLLLAYMALNNGSVLLLDEPDAHLEILRQRQIYNLLCENARASGSQLIIASHSEVVLNEAADRDVVVAFVGKPHRIDDRGSQVLKSLREIGFQDYYQAEQKGWVLYLEGATDLAILQSFAQRLHHIAGADLQQLFVVYVANQPQKARSHLQGLAEAKHDLIGILICDRLERELQPSPRLVERMWQRKEIENYLCQPQTLRAWAAAAARDEAAGPLFEAQREKDYVETMDDCIRRLVPPVALESASDPFWSQTKVSDFFLDRLFQEFYRRLGLPNLMSKSNYHVLARYVPEELIDPEISTVLHAIHTVAADSKPGRRVEMKIGHCVHWGAIVGTTPKPSRSPNTDSSSRSRTAANFQRDSNYT